MTDSTAEATEGEQAEGTCIFCGTLTTFGGYYSGTFGISVPEGGGQPSLVKMPRLWMCPEDLGRYKRQEIWAGWCLQCAAWGEAGTVSPCGQWYNLVTR